MIKLLKYPYPYKAWLSISNDPDNTTIEVWHELNEFIFNELKLGWANNIFIYSHNLNLPNQVCLDKFPEIASQPTDTLHTWGDFVHSGQRGFSRADAEAGIMLLQKYNIRPRVWVDHSRFVGNMIHTNNWGSVPFHNDSSGNKYRVYEYTLDLAKQLGISYIWDGKLSQHIGQDRNLKLRDRLMQFSFLGQIRFALLYGLKYVVPGLFRYNDNKQYQEHTFSDGNRMYLFKRFGKWRDADILGLSKVLSEANVNRLIQKGGSMLAYTHLGKSNPKYMGKTHIPEETKACLRFVKEKVESKELMFSSVSKMLDYMVLRDNIVIKQHEIQFIPDGIRFVGLTKQDLSGHKFSFSGISDTNNLIVKVQGQEIKPYSLQHTNGIVDLIF